MTPATITIPTYPPLKKEEATAKPTTAVERSLARPDAWAKPGTIGKTQVRTTTVKPKSGRQRKRKRDPRDVKFY